METRALGSRSQLQCTKLGLGGASLGDLFVKITTAEAIETVERAYELGMRYFDTAPWYGIGKSEIRMGLALSSFPRNTYALSTKVGRYLKPHSDPTTFDRMGWAGALQNGIEFAYGYDDVLRQHEDSLQRVGVGRVECLVIHDMEEAEGQQPTHPRGVRSHLAGIDGAKGGYHALVELRAQGKIKAFGAGCNLYVGCPNHTKETYRAWNVGYIDFLLGLASASGAQPLDFLLLAGTHTLLDLSAWEDGILDKCLEHGVGIVMGQAFASGILATGAVPGAKFNYEDASDDMLAKVKRIEAVCAEFDVPIAAVALQFPLGHPAVSTVIPGCKSAAEAERSVATAEVAIPARLWARLKEERLLPAGVPTPGDPTGDGAAAAKKARSTD